MLPPFSAAQTHHMVAHHSYGVSHTGVIGTRDRMDHTIFCDVALCGAIAVFECAVDHQVSPLVGGGKTKGLKEKQYLHPRPRKLTIWLQYLVFFGIWCGAAGL